MIFFNSSYGLSCVYSEFIYWPATFPVYLRKWLFAVFGDMSFKEVTILNEVISEWSFRLADWCLYKTRKKTGTDAQVMWRHSKKMVICKPSTEDSEIPNPSVAWIGLQFPELWENEFLSFRPPICGILLCDSPSKWIQCFSETSTISLCSFSNQWNVLKEIYLAFLWFCYFITGYLRYSIENKLKKLILTAI